MSATQKVALAPAAHSPRELPLLVHPEVARCSYSFKMSLLTSSRSRYVPVMSTGLLLLVREEWMCAIHTSLTPVIRSQISRESQTKSITKAILKRKRNRWVATYKKATSESSKFLFFLRIDFLACFSYTLAQSEDRYISKFEPTGLDNAEHLCIRIGDGDWVKMLVFLSVKWGVVLALWDLFQLLTLCGQFCCYSFMLHLRILQSSKRMLLKTLDSCILMYCVLKSVIIWYEEKGKNMYRSCQNQTSLVAQMVKDLPAMQETWVWSLGWEDPLEKGTAAHSSILAWRIPWTEEPGRLQSMGSQRVGHDQVTSTHLSKHQYHW